MTDRTKQKIETFMKEEKRNGLKFVNFPIESSLRRAILLGLELGKEAARGADVLAYDKKAVSQRKLCLAAIQSLIDALKK